MDRYLPQVFDRVGAVDTGAVPPPADLVWRSVISSIAWRDGAFYADVSYEVSSMEPTFDQVIEIRAVNGAISAAIAAIGPDGLQADGTREHPYDATKVPCDETRDGAWGMSGTVPVLCIPPMGWNPGE